jgi:hypothetical protein
MRQGQALPIVCVKDLDFQGAPVGLRKQDDTAIGHRAIHIHQQQFDLRGTFLERGR